jgi:acyl-CoA dehydrogenase
MIFARTSGKAGDGDGITAFLVPTSSPGFEVLEYLWTFNMPTDHAHIRLTDVRVPHGAIFGGEGRGLQVVQHFFNENRIRQAASSLGAAQFCIDEAVKPTRRSASPSARRSPPTRPSSSRSSSCRPSARCSAR